MFKRFQVWFSSLFQIHKKQVEGHKVEKPPAQDLKRYISHHAQKRFQERHGVIFTNAQARSIVVDILSRKAEFIKDQPGETELWIAEYQGNKYRVIYSTGNKVIVTVYSGIKDKKRKPKRHKKFRADTGKRGKSAEGKLKSPMYKRNKFKETLTQYDERR